MNPQLEELRFDPRGLIPVVVQDVASNEVLMVAWMNREALEKTLQTGKIHTFSRSRGRLALKGESSGHFQLVKELYTDCDQDVLLFRVEQKVAACHMGYRSCFYRRYDPAGRQWQVVASKVFDPEQVYAGKHSRSM